MKKILIADDRSEVVELVRVSLESDEYEVIDASDGKEALEKIEKEKPDLVLLDVVMPHMSGFQVLERLKQDTQTNQIPVIMLTAQGQKLDREAGTKLGAHAYITKPFSPSTLLAKIQEVLASSK